MNKQITILGLGNPLLGDDGIGPRVVEEVKKAGLPDGIEAVAAGGSFYQFWDILAGSKKIIAVDALQFGGFPGTMYLLHPHEILREVDSGAFEHEVSFLNTLDFLADYNVRPEVLIVGIEPKEIKYSLELSPEIREKIPDIVRIIRKLCKEGGK